jgi:hypothetical protein
VSDPGVDDLVRGAWDLHVHAAPSLFERWGDVWDLAGACHSAGMAGAVLKSHHGSSVEAATLVTARTRPFTVLGGIVLNEFVGGLNPFAVEASLALGGKVVWLPTIHAAAHAACFGSLGDFPFQASRTGRRPEEGLRVTDPAGRLTPRAHEVLDVMHGRDAVLATGHISADEILRLASAIRERQRDVRLLVTHAFFKVPHLSVDQLRGLQSERTWFEAAYFTVSPRGNATAQQVAGWIRALPDAQWVLSSDSGQPGNPSSPHALGVFGRHLIEGGLDEAVVRGMLATQPPRLLYRDGRA